MLMSNFWNMFFRNRVSYGTLPCPEIPVFWIFMGKTINSVDIRNNFFCTIRSYNYILINSNENMEWEKRKSKTYHISVPCRINNWNCRFLQGWKGWWPISYFHYTFSNTRISDRYRSSYFMYWDILVLQRNRQPVQ